MLILFRSLQLLVFRALEFPGPTAEEALLGRTTAVFIIFFCAFVDILLFDCGTEVLTSSAAGSSLPIGFVSRTLVAVVLLVVFFPVDEAPPVLLSTQLVLVQVQVLLIVLLIRVLLLRLLQVLSLLLLQVLRRRLLLPILLLLLRPRLRLRMRLIQLQLLL